MNAQEEKVGAATLPSKLAQVAQSRKVWAGVLGLLVTGALWWVGEIESARALEAMTWVVGIFIGSVALEDGMARMFSSLAQGMREGSEKSNGEKKP
jgi:hypothetical protein